MLRTVLGTAILWFSLAATAWAGETVIGKRAPATDVRLYASSPERVYVIRGDIEQGADVLFKEAIAGVRGGWLVLSSQGGDTEASMQIGRLAHLYGIKTYVPTNGLCLSGCAIIWAGGVERWVSKGAVLGFHHPWFVADDGTVKKGDGKSIRVYFRQLGFSPETIEKFLMGPQQFYYLTADAAKQLGVDAHFRR